MAQPSTEHLLSLPFDLLVRIESFCSVQDLLVLRMCSKYLEQISRERIIWIQALERVIYELHLYPPTFPFDSMSTYQLEQCTTAHFRLLQGLAHGQTSRPRPRTTISGSFRFAGGCLVQGGRYLVLLSRYNVELWDIHPPFSDVDKEPVKIASFDHAILQDLTLWVDVDVDRESRLVVRIQCFRFSDQGTWCSVLRIDPLAPDPAFELIGHLDTMLFTSAANYFDPFNMVTVFSVPDAKETWVWYVSSGHLVMWNEAAGARNVQIFVCDQKILCANLGHSQGRVYALPKEPAGSVSSIGHQFLRMEPPILDVLDWEDEMPDDVAHVEASFWSPSWVSPPLDKSFRVDLIIEHFSEDRSTTTIHMEVSSCEDKDAGKSTFCITPLHKARYAAGLIPIPHHSDISSITFSNGIRLLWWVGDTNTGRFPHRRVLRMHISSLEPGNTQNIEGGRVQMLNVAPNISSQLGWWIRNFHFDPTIGRLFIFSNFGSTVDILDLTRQPEKPVELMEYGLDHLFGYEAP